MFIRSHLFQVPRTPVPAKGDIDWARLDTEFLAGKMWATVSKRLQIINRVYT